MGGQRAQRVARQILQELSMIAERDLADPRLNLVTFTGVKMSPDLRNARVLFSCLGDDEERRRCGEGLAHASGLLRREIGRRLPLRYVPELHFEVDDSLERSERIARLLERAGERSDDGEDG